MQIHEFARQVAGSPPSDRYPLSQAEQFWVTPSDTQLVCPAATVTVPLVQIHEFARQVAGQTFFLDRASIQASIQNQALIQQKTLIMSMELHVSMHVRDNSLKCNVLERPNSIKKHSNSCSANNSTFSNLSGSMLRASIREWIDAKSIDLKRSV